MSDSLGLDWMKQSCISIRILDSKRLCFLVHRCCKAKKIQKHHWLVKPVSGLKR